LNLKNIKVLLADDHPIVMNGFSIALDEYEVNIVGMAKTPEEAIKIYSTCLPDVAILDIRFGEKKSGFDAAKEILQKYPKAKIIFLSQFDEDNLIKEAYKMGAKAYLTKDCQPDELATAVQRADQGATYFLPQIAERLANLSVREDNTPQSQLDKRELEIFILLARGRTIAEIAEELNLSLKTISNISHTIKQKLNITRPADLTRLAIKHDYIEP